MAVRKQSAAIPDEPAEPPPAVAELPEGWQSRHPRLTYADETPAQHASRLRTLADGVPAKRERFLELADELEAED